jgi:uncharacterized protein
MNITEARARGAAIQTASGKFAFPLDPYPEMLDINDIGLALSNQCRFSGHVKQFYSVAEHSVRVSNYVHSIGGSPMEVFWGLMHDASEAYLVDLARPIKQDPSFAEGYRNAEERLMAVICERFGLPAEMPEIVHLADQVLLSTEQRDLMPPGEVWYPEVPRIAETIVPMRPEVAHAQFMTCFRVLRYAGSET